MDSAKTLAKEMLASLNLEDEGMLVSYVKGIVSFPVNLYFLADDFIRTDNRKENMDDEMRLAELVHRATSKKHINLIAKSIKVFIDDYLKYVNVSEVIKKTAEDAIASSLGGITFSSLTGLNIGKLISSRITMSIAFNMSISTLLLIGGGASRAIHASRHLKTTNYGAYRQLKDLGDLDLLYFVIKDRVQPFEKITKLARTNSQLFNKATTYFFKGL